MTHRHLHFDFETRSVLDLREVGLHNYARHPSTEPWCAAYAVDDSPVEIWSGLPHGLPEQIRSCLANGAIFVAHNAPFELEIWNEIMAPRAGWPRLDPSQVVCTMAAAYAMGLPGALEDAAMAMGLDVQKDMEGRALILRMARPRSLRPDGSPVWWDDPDRVARGQAYCKQDVVVERELHKRLMPLGERERRIWFMDYQINQRGMLLDVESARASIAFVEAAKEECNARLAKLTDNAAQSVNALVPLKEWLTAIDPAQDWTSLAKEQVTDLLELDALAPLAREALLIRQEASKASTAKLGPMLSIVGADGRMRNTAQYHGAATGRWAGRKIQPQNFPRDSHKERDAETILRWIREGNAAGIDLVFGPPLSQISRCLKAFIRAPEGKLLNVGDFASIEGRGTAWVSGEEWKLAAFRAADAGTGPGIYELSYARSFNAPVESVKNPSVERQIGKVQELALGYQGGVGAFRRMGATYGVKVVERKGLLRLAKGQFELTEVEAGDIKDRWRAAHPMTVAAWGQLNTAALSAVQAPGKIYTACQGRVKFRVAGSFLWCLLPSGRALCYAYPKLMPGRFGGAMLTYMAVPSADDRKLGRVIDDPHNSRNWARLSTYGGSLMENVVQAICRDILADKMLRFTEAGWKIVLHVHDEIANEEDGDRTAEMNEIMRAPVSWAPGFPIYAECHAMRRYGK